MKRRESGLKSSCSDVIYCEGGLQEVPYIQFVNFVYVHKYDRACTPRH